MNELPEGLDMTKTKEFGEVWEKEFKNWIDKYKEANKDIFYGIVSLTNENKFMEGLERIGCKYKRCRLSEVVPMESGKLVQASTVIYEIHTRK